jgi:predicted ABC-class ATPase
MGHPRSMPDLIERLGGLDGLPYLDYQDLRSRTYRLPQGLLRFVHIQGSPGAFPASVCHLALTPTDLDLDDRCFANPPRRIAAEDYFLRAFGKAVMAHARQNRGAQGSGSFQPLFLPPQVLERNVVRLNRTQLRIAFHISLPGSDDNKILGGQAVQMFTREVPAIVDAVAAAAATRQAIKRHCDVVEDMRHLQRRLTRLGLVAFIGDGAILPRQSGVSQAPLKKNAIAFHAPDAMAVKVALPNAGRLRGLGIRPGVNVMIGGGFHGKSTLLHALAKGVYPHIPGDGRERVVTHPDALFICAEEGRSVHGLNISGFIDNLPGNVDAAKFRTNNASGSTSQAAAIVEAVLAGAKLMLIDEDSSATNFLIKDQNMRRLVPEDTITPLFDRVRELYHRFGVSTLIVVGGSSDYLGVAGHVLAMRHYLPEDVTDQLRHLVLPEPEPPERPLVMADNRRVTAGNFDPRYRVERLDKTLPVRIKPLRLQENILEYGDEQLDLTKLIALVDPHQIVAVGYALLLARHEVKKHPLSPTQIAEIVCRRIEQEGLNILSRKQSKPLFFARPRRLELAAAINRLRSLKVDIAE